MKFFKSLLYMLPQVWRALWRGPQTVRYPFGPPELPEGFRGQVVVDPEKCRGCSLCVRDCPAEALDLQRRGKGQYRLIYHPDRCAYCGQCELSCNFDALHLSNVFVPGSTDQETFKVVLVDRDDKPDP